MKKISKKDLSLQRETVSFLSDQNSAGVDDNTNTCTNTMGLTCPTATFATVCFPCETGVNCEDTMNEQTCAQTKAHCPPDPPVNLSKDNPEACLLTAEFCETKNICPNTNGEICKTKHCEAISVELRCLTKPCP